MKLKPEDAGLFYELFLPLLDYVNDNFNVTIEKVRFCSLPRKTQKIDKQIAKK